MKSQRNFLTPIIGGVAGMIVIGATLALFGLPSAATASPSRSPALDGSPPEYIVLAWNDLGMHCYNPDFQYLAVLPPYNTLWAQVIRRSDPPQIVTTGITVTYAFPDNTYSVGKSNFWDYEQDTFGVDLPPNVGLTGKGLAGTMDLLAGGTYFIAEGIPLTEYRDSDYQVNPTNPTPYPYQLAVVTVRDSASGEILAQTTTVAPVSTEMHCDTCHYDGGQEDIATGSVDLNILTLHDLENMEEYPVGHTGALVSRAPILCAECHASNALGEPGITGVPKLSNAIHEKHKDEVTQDLDGCYNCHPGPQTQCLRDVMFFEHEKDCVDCHGTMAEVASKNNPWFNEPRCDNGDCHGNEYRQDQLLYRLSREHGGVYCAGCHDSPHAIVPSQEPNDAIKFLALQGVNAALGADDHCDVCHGVFPDAAGPHDIAPSQMRTFTFTPEYFRIEEPGNTVVYTHTLQNTGNVSDTYGIAWTSSQEWADVVVWKDSATVELPVPLQSGESVLVRVTVTIPDTDQARGLWEQTVITATSLVDPALVATVTDVTFIPKTYVYLPAMLRSY